MKSFPDTGDIAHATIRRSRAARCQTIEWVSRNEGRKTPATERIGREGPSGYTRSENSLGTNPL